MRELQVGFVGVNFGKRWSDAGSSRESRDLYYRATSGREDPKSESREIEKMIYRSHFGLEMSLSDVTEDSFIRGDVRFPDNHSVNRSYIEVPEGVTVEVGDNVTFTNSYIKVDLPKGSTVRIPPGMVIDGSRLTINEKNLAQIEGAEGAYIYRYYEGTVNQYDVPIEKDRVISTLYMKTATGSEGRAVSHYIDIVKGKERDDLKDPNFLKGLNGQVALQDIFAKGPAMVDFIAAYQMSKDVARAIEEEVTAAKTPSIPESKAALVVMVTGGAGTGKTTLATLYAKKLDAFNLSIGSIYRAATWLVIKNNLDMSKPEDRQRLIDELKNIQPVNNAEYKPRIIYKGEDVSDELELLRPEIDRTISQIGPHLYDIATLSWVKMVDDLMAQGKNAVVELRPSAIRRIAHPKVEVYLTAPVNIRAERRAMKDLIPSLGLKRAYLKTVPGSTGDTYDALIKTGRGAVVRAIIKAVSDGIIERDRKDGVSEESLAGAVLKDNAVIIKTALVTPEDGADKISEKVKEVTDRIQAHRQEIQQLIKYAMEMSPDNDQDLDGLRSRMLMMFPDMGNFIKGKMEHTLKVIACFNRLIHKDYEYFYNRLDPKLREGMDAEAKGLYFRSLDTLFEFYHNLPPVQRNVLTLSIIMHDMGYTRKVRPFEHPALSGQIVYELLSEKGLNGGFVNDVATVARYHAHVGNVGVGERVPRELLRLSPTVRSQVVIANSMDTAGYVDVTGNFVKGESNRLTQTVLNVFLTYHDKDALERLDAGDYFDYRMKKLSRKKFGEELTPQQLDQLMGEIARVTPSNEMAAVKRHWNSRIVMMCFPLNFSMADSPTYERVAKLYKLLAQVSEVFSKRDPQYEDFEIDLDIEPFSMFNASGKMFFDNFKTFLDRIPVNSSLGGVERELSTHDWKQVFDIPITMVHNRLVINISKMRAEKPEEGHAFRAIGIGGFLMSGISAGLGVAFAILTGHHDIASWLGVMGVIISLIFAVTGFIRASYVTSFMYTKAPEGSFISKLFYALRKPIARHGQIETPLLDEFEKTHSYIARAIRTHELYPSHWSLGALLPFVPGATLLQLMLAALIIKRFIRPASPLPTHSVLASIFRVMRPITLAVFIAIGTFISGCNKADEQNNPYQTMANKWNDSSAFFPKENTITAHLNKAKHYLTLSINDTITIKSIAVPTSYKYEPGLAKKELQKALEQIRKLYGLGVLAEKDLNNLPKDVASVINLLEFLIKGIPDVDKEIATEGRDKYIAEIKILEMLIQKAKKIEVVYRKQEYPLSVKETGASGVAKPIEPGKAGLGGPAGGNLKSETSTQHPFRAIGIGGFALTGFSTALAIALSVLMKNYDQLAGPGVMGVIIALVFAVTSFFRAMVVARFMYTKAPQGSFISKLHYALTEPIARHGELVTPLLDEFEIKHQSIANIIRWHEFYPYHWSIKGLFPFVPGATLLDMVICALLVNRKTFNIHHEENIYRELLKSLGKEKLINERLNTFKIARVNGKPIVEYLIDMVSSKGYRVKNISLIGSYARYPQFNDMDIIVVVAGKGRPTKWLEKMTITFDDGKQVESHALLVREQTAREDELWYTKYAYAKAETVYGEDIFNWVPSKEIQRKILKDTFEAAASVDGNKKIHRLVGANMMAYKLYGEEKYLREAQSLWLSLKRSNKLKTDILSMQGRSVVFIAGASASGKTSFAARIAGEIGNDRHAVALSLDRYYKDMDEMPRLPDGKPDFSTPHAVHLDWVRDDIRKLLNGEEVDLPSFDMTTGRSMRNSGERISLRGNGILFVESVYAFHDTVLEGATGHENRKIFIDVPVELRIIRRMIRDAFGARQKPPYKTLSRWDMVRREESEFIMPAKGKADHHIENYSKDEINRNLAVAVSLLAEAYRDAEEKRDKASGPKGCDEAIAVINIIEDLARYLLPQEILFTGSQDIGVAGEEHVKDAIELIALADRKVMVGDNPRGVDHLVVKKMIRHGKGNNLKVVGADKIRVLSTIAQAGEAGITTKIINQAFHESPAKFTARDRAMVEMLAPAGLVYAIWDGRSKGTKNTFDYGRMQEIRTIVFDESKETEKAITLRKLGLIASKGRFAFVMIKPDGIAQKRQIIDFLEAKGLTTVHEGKPVRLTREQAEEFYSMHKGQSYYERLLDYVMSGEVIPVIVQAAQANAVEEVRGIIGPTRGGRYEDEKAKAGAFIVASGTVRGEFMTDDDRNARPIMRNKIHASDSAANVVREASIAIGMDALDRILNIAGLLEARKEQASAEGVPFFKGQRYGGDYIPSAWQNVPCPLCGSDDCAPVSYSRFNKIVKCNRCEMLYTNPQAVEEPDDYYNYSMYKDLKTVPDAVTSKESARGQQQAAFIVDIINRSSHGKKGAKFLDVGSAFGFTLYHLRQDHGWPNDNLVGVELSPKAAKLGSEGLGVNNRAGSLQEQRFGEGEFDIIFLGEAIEHISKPAEFMKEIYRILKPGGMAIFTDIPNNGGVLARAAQEKNPSFASLVHFSHFTPQTFEKFLHLHGFKMVASQGSVRLRDKDGKYRESLEEIATRVLGIPAVDERAKLDALKNVLMPTLRELNIPFEDSDFGSKDSFESFWNSKVSPSFTLGSEMAVVATVEEKPTLPAKTMREAIADIQSLGGRSVVLIAGPSASGKTSIVEKIAGEVKTKRQVVVLSLDRYYKNPADMPKMPTGKAGFATPRAVDLTLAKEHIRRLLNGEEVEVPRFDMDKGISTLRSGDTYSLGESGILIVESVYALRDEVLEGLKGHEYRKIFIDVPVELRQIRKMVRDALGDRQKSPYKTLFRWHMVTEEDRLFVIPTMKKAEYSVINYSEEEMDEYITRAVPLLAQALEEARKKNDSVVAEMIADLAKKIFPDEILFTGPAEISEEGAAQVRAAIELIALADRKVIVGDTPRGVDRLVVEEMIGHNKGRNLTVVGVGNIRVRDEMKDRWDAGINTSILGEGFIEEPLKYSLRNKLMMIRLCATGLVYIIKDVESSGIKGPFEYWPRQGIRIVVFNAKAKAHAFRPVWAIVTGLVEIGLLALAVFVSGYNQMLADFMPFVGPVLFFTGLWHLAWGFATAIKARSFIAELGYSNIDYDAIRSRISGTQDSREAVISELAQRFIDSYRARHQVTEVNVKVQERARKSARVFVEMLHKDAEGKSLFRVVNRWGQAIATHEKARFHIYGMLTPIPIIGATIEVLSRHPIVTVLSVGLLMVPISAIGELGAPLGIGVIIAFTLLKNRKSTKSRLPGNIGTFLTVVALGPLAVLGVVGLQPGGKAEGAEEPDFDAVNRALIAEAQERAALIDAYRDVLPEDARDIQPVPQEFVERCAREMFTQNHVVKHKEALEKEIFELWQLYLLASKADAGTYPYYVGVNEKRRITSRNAPCTQVVVASPDRVGAEEGAIRRIAELGIDKLGTYSATYDGVFIALYQLQKDRKELSAANIGELFRPFHVVDVEGVSAIYRQAHAKATELLNGVHRCDSNGIPGGIWDGVVWVYSGENLHMDGIRSKYSIDSRNDEKCEKMHVKSIFKPYLYDLKKTIAALREEDKRTRDFLQNTMLPIAESAYKKIVIGQGRPNAATQLFESYIMMQGYFKAAARGAIGVKDTSLNNRFVRFMLALDRGYGVEANEVEMEQEKLLKCFGQVESILENEEEIGLAREMAEDVTDGIRKERRTARFLLWEWLEKKSPLNSILAEKIVNELCLAFDVEEVTLEDLEKVIEEAKGQARDVDIIAFSRELIRDDLILRALTEKYGIKTFICCNGSTQEHSGIMITASGAMLAVNLPQIVFDRLIQTEAETNASLVSSETGFESFLYIGPPQSEEDRRIGMDIITANVLKEYFVRREAGRSQKREEALTLNGDEKKKLPVPVYGNIHVPYHLRTGDFGIREESAIGRLEKVYHGGGNGVALGRTEYMYTRATPPDFRTQRALYKGLADVADKPVTLRTFDKRDDKECIALPHVSLPDAGPQFGFDYYRTEPGRDALKTQVKAMLAAFAESKYGNLKMMFPSVEDMRDIEFIHGILEEAKAEIIAEHRKITRATLDEMPIGIMFETKEIIENLTEVLDNSLVKISFVSIGTNDLISKVKGISRRLLKNAHFDKEIMGIIENVVKEAAARGISVTVCGDVARFDKAMMFGLYLYKRYGIPLILSVISDMIPRLKTNIEFTDSDNCAGFFEEWGAKTDDQINTIVRKKTGIRIERIKQDPLFMSLFSDRMRAATGQPIAPRNQIRIGLGWAVIGAAIAAVSALYKNKVFTEMPSEIASYAGIFAGVIIGLYCLAHVALGAYLYWVKRTGKTRAGPGPYELIPFLKNGVEDNNVDFAEVDQNGILHVNKTNLSFVHPLIQRVIALHEMTHLWGRGEALATLLPMLGIFYKQKFIVGVPPDTSLRDRQALTRIFGRMISVKDMPLVDNVKDLQKIAAAKGLPAIFLTRESIGAITASQGGKTGTEAALRALKGVVSDAGFYAYLKSHPEISLNFDTLVLRDDRSRESLAKMVREIKAFLPDIETLDIESIADALAKGDSFRRYVDTKSQSLKNLLLMRRYITELVYTEGVKGAIDEIAQEEAPVVLATTEKIAECEPFTFNDSIIGKVGRKNVKHAFIYGDILKTEEQARKFVRASGYEDRMDKIVFVNKAGRSYDEIMGEIEVKTGAARSAIGIRAAKDELGKKATDASIMLEIEQVTIKGRPVYAAFGSYKALLRMLTQHKGTEAGEPELPPGVFKTDIAGVFTYLPRALPIDYGEEIETYRTAMRLLSAAA